ncbi:MAG TPA: xanthine dehydrogenase family protein subunit M [Geminicoccaceae bacterium]|nr:xanthine dehydrogenase family protein subunit M [Geminicoccus sp.]HMU52045.1 xanthine dehydrogenase family protein subunit M [Geminicoccaceae bacterium]
MHNFAYHKPASLADAAALLASHEDAKLLAGGQTYIPTLKQRLAQPTDVIDLGGIAELEGIKEEAGGVTIGAMTRHGEVAESAIVKRVIPALAALAHLIGDPAVRNRGTIGGSISNNDPAADYPGACLALGATIRTTRREIGADAFFTGMFETALERDEIVKAVHFPRADKAAYEKFPNPASRYAMVGAFVARTGNGVKVAITGAGQGGAYRWTEAEQALGSTWSASAIDGLTVSPDDMNSDIHASSEYRAHLVKVITKRALAKAG